MRWLPAPRASGSPRASDDLHCIFLSFLLFPSMIVLVFTSSAHASAYDDCPVRWISYHACEVDSSNHIFLSLFHFQFHSIHSVELEESFSFLQTVNFFTRRVRARLSRSTMWQNYVATTFSPAHSFDPSPDSLSTHHSEPLSAPPSAPAAASVAPLPLLSCASRPPFTMVWSARTTADTAAWLIS